MTEGQQHAPGRNGGGAKAPRPRVRLVPARKGQVLQIPTRLPGSNVILQRFSSAARSPADAGEHGPAAPGSQRA